MNLFPVALTLAIGGALAFLTGCQGGNKPMEEPRDRLGAMPFPGAFTLYRVADPQFLGRHCYEHSPIQAADESEGLVYTTRAGLIDLGHVRITIDTVRYCTNRIRTAMRNGQSSVTLPTLEGSTFVVQLHDVPGLLPMPQDAEPDPEREHLADELALCIGQRATYLMMTWHEVLTWFGWRTVSLIDESPSAFTWDDSMSHVIGLRIAAQVLREPPGKSFDDAVTAALRKELNDLGVLSATETDRATRATEGIWWADAKPLKRQLDIGLSDNTIRPWLVPGFGPADADPEVFTLPTIKDVLGHDYSGCYSIRIDPLVPQAQSLRNALPSHPALLDGERDVPLLVEVTRQQMRQRLSEDVDQPLPKVATSRPSGDPQRISLAPGQAHKSR